MLRLAMQRLDETRLSVERRDASLHVHAGRCYMSKEFALDASGFAAEWQNTSLSC